MSGPWECPASGKPISLCQCSTCVKMLQVICCDIRSLSREDPEQETKEEEGADGVGMPCEWGTD